MSLSFVSVICDLYDGTGTPLGSGTVTFTPTAATADVTDHLEITLRPVTVSLAGNPLPAVDLAATDSGSLAPSGWLWRVAFAFPGAPRPAMVAIAAADGSPQYLSQFLAG